MSNRVNLTLDVTKTGIQNPLIKVRQGDGGFETLRTTVTSNGEPLDLQGWTITFMGTTAGSHKIVDDNVTVVEAPNGIFDYTPSKAWGMDIGEFKIAYFNFVKGDGSASSANFRVNVIEAVDLTQEEAQNYISVVDATIAEAREHLESSLADVSSSVAATSVAASSMAVSVSNTASSAVGQLNSAASNASSAVSSAVNNVSSVASDAVSKVNSASNTYVKKANLLPAEARDFNYLATHMKTYQGFWYVVSEGVANGPKASWTWAVIEVVAGNSEATGVIKTTKFADNLTYLASVNDGKLRPWKLIADDNSVVHKTDNETIAGDKTFTGTITAANILETGTPQSATATTTFNGLTFSFTRVGSSVYVTTGTTTVTTAIQVGSYNGIIPSGYLPIKGVELAYLQKPSAAGFVSVYQSGGGYFNTALAVGDKPRIVGYYPTTDPWPAN